MPLYPHENWGDIQNHTFMKGIITSVNSEKDTANVTVPGGEDGEGVPIFYHCDPDSEERANGAIEGGAGGFSKDDEVIVMCTVDGEPVRVVGHVDGVKSCETLWILIKAGGYAYALFDPSTDSLVEGLKDAGGGDVEFPVASEWTGNPDESIWWTDHADYLETDKWRSLWKADEGYGTWWLNTTEVLTSNRFDDLTGGLDDEYDYEVEYIEDTIARYMLNNTAFKEVESNDSPASVFFPEPLMTKLDRYREVAHRTEWNGPDGATDPESTLVQIQWDDEKTYDATPFLVAKNVVESDDEYEKGTYPEEVKFATRYKDEDFYDLTNLMVYRYVDDVMGNQYLNMAESDLRFKTTKKKTVLRIEPPDGYLEDAFVEEEVEIYNKYIERKQPWDFDDFEKDAIPITPWSEFNHVGVYAYQFFPYHPNMEDVTDVYPWSPDSHLAMSLAWPYAPWNNRYDRASSYKPPAFEEDEYFSDQLRLASCVGERNWQEHQANMFQGADGCSGWEGGCKDCMEPTDSGQMFTLHQEYRGDTIVPVAAISNVCQALAEEMDLGTHGYDHDGFDERVAEILSKLDCVKESMGENLARVPVTVGPGDPEHPNPPYDPVDAAFNGYTYGSGTHLDGWLDSPGHLANLSNPDWTMMGYGSAGEYHVTIFGELTTACKYAERFTSYSVMKVSDETKVNARIQAGLDPGDPFPAEEITPDYLPPNWVGKGYMALPYSMFPAGAAQWATLVDGKIREADRYHVEFNSSIFCDDDDETPGIINVVIGYPLTSSPNKLMVERDSDAVRNSVKVHASYDIGMACNTKQRPVEMGRSVAFEEAIANVLKMHFDQTGEKNNHSVFPSTLTIQVVRPKTAEEP